MKEMYGSVVLSWAQPCPHSFKSDMECNVYISQDVYADMVLSIGARSVQHSFVGEGASGFYEIFFPDVMKCDACIVQQCCVSGGTTMFRGIVERIHDEDQASAQIRYGFDEQNLGIIVGDCRRARVIPRSSLNRFTGICFLNPGEHHQPAHEGCAVDIQHIEVFVWAVQCGIPLWDERRAELFLFSTSSRASLVVKTTESDGTSPWFFFSSDCSHTHTHACPCSAQLGLLASRHTLAGLLNPFPGCASFDSCKWLDIAGVEIETWILQKNPR